MKTLIKRIYAVVVVIALALGAINFAPSYVKAEEEFYNHIFGKDIKNNDIKYTFSNGTLTAEGKGYADCSYTCKKSAIKNIIIKEGIKGIADYAFNDCTNIKSLSIPKSVYEIGFYAFGSAKLPTITIPNTVYHIGCTAFNTREPFSVTIPGDFNPYWTSYLDGEDNYIAYGFKKVQLNSPYDPHNKIQFVSDSINTMKGDPKYKSYKGVVYSKNGKTLVQVPANAKKINIRKGCTKIMMSALLYYRSTEEDNYVLSKAKKITIPKTVKKVVNDMGSEHPSFGGGVKWNIKTKKLTGESVENLYSMMSGKAAKKFINSKNARLKKKKTMKITKDNVLVKYTGKSKTVKIPAKVKRIGQSAFSSYKCKAKKIILNKKLKSIGAYAFAGCTNIKKVVWNKKLKTVGNKAFENCSIQNLKIPSSVKNWGVDCFANNGSKTFKLPKNMDEIPEGMFISNNFKNIVIPKTVDTVGEMAFAYSNKCKTITFKEGVREIQVAAFDRCDKLDKVVIPKSVKEIGASAFMDTKIKVLELKNPKVRLYDGTAFYQIDVIDCGTNPSDFTTFASLYETNLNGEAKFYRSKVKGASGMELQVSKEVGFKNPFVKNDIKNESGTITFMRPNGDYNEYRIRVYTIKNGNKVYGPWRDFGW